jgi:hypothetical protein
MVKRLTANLVMDPSRLVDAASIGRSGWEVQRNFDGAATITNAPRAYVRKEKLTA